MPAQEFCATRANGFRLRSWGPKCEQAQQTSPWPTRAKQDGEVSQERPAAPKPRPEFQFFLAEQLDMLNTRLLTVLGSVLVLMLFVSPAARADDDIDQKAVDRAHDFLKTAKRGRDVL